MSKIDEIERIQKELKKMLEKAKRDLKEISAISVNSYGAGFEAGSVSAYEQMLAYLDDFYHD